jgi:hypothetical protein
MLLLTCYVLLLLLLLLLGHVITNYHVITDASDIQVTFMGGAEYSAKVIGVDQDKDVAVLQVGDVCSRLAALLKGVSYADQRARCHTGGVWWWRSEDLPHC